MWDHAPYTLSDAAFIQEVGRVFPQELDRLKRATPSIEARAETSHQGSDPSPSTLLYGFDYPEVNRTIVSTLALKWILQDRYETFTSGQPEPVRLSRESFTELRIFFQRRLETGETDDLMVAIVVADLGKDPATATKLIESLPPSSYSADHNRLGNHDQIIYQAAIAGLEPLITAQRTPYRRTDLISGLEFGAGLNLPQFVQGECPAASLEGAFCLTNKPRAFELKFMEVILDVAGAAGNIQPYTSLTFTQPVFESFMSAHKLILKLLNDRIPRVNCYNMMLAQRNDMLVRAGGRAMSTWLPDHRATLRMYCMARVYDQYQAQCFDDAMKMLNPEDTRPLIQGLNINGIDDGTAILPYYMPGLFAAGLKNCPNTWEAKVQAMASLLVFLSRVVGSIEQVPGLKGAVAEYDVSFAHETVSSAKFREDPWCVARMELPS